MAQERIRPESPITIKHSFDVREKQDQALPRKERLGQEQWEVSRENTVNCAHSGCPCCGR